MFYLKYIQAEVATPTKQEDEYSFHSSFQSSFDTERSPTLLATFRTDSGSKSNDVSLYTFCETLLDRIEAYATKRASEPPKNIGALIANDEKCAIPTPTVDTARLRFSTLCRSKAARNLTVDLSSSPLEKHVRQGARESENNSKCSPKQLSWYQDIDAEKGAPTVAIEREITALFDQLSKVLNNKLNMLSLKHRDGGELRNMLCRIIAHCEDTRIEAAYVDSTDRDRKPCGSKLVCEEELLLCEMLENEFELLVRSSELDCNP